MISSPPIAIGLKLVLLDARCLHSAPEPCVALSGLGGVLFQAQSWSVKITMLSGF